MASYSKQLLSGSTNGQPILIAATSSPGTLIHTATSSTVDFDEIWLWCQNTSASAVNLTIQYGGTTSPNNNFTLSMAAASGLYLLVPGLILNNSLVVRAFAGTASVLTITGFVNRITA